MKKRKELGEGIDFAMMQTNLMVTPSHSIPMGTKEVDEEGFIWFLNNKNSMTHNRHLISDKSIQSMYSKPSAMEFMTVYGHAFITTDRAVLEPFYRKSEDTLFKGMDDPNLTAIKVVPEDAHYWETKNGKFSAPSKIGCRGFDGKNTGFRRRGRFGN